MSEKNTTQHFSPRSFRALRFGLFLLTMGVALVTSVVLNHWDAIPKAWWRPFDSPIYICVTSIQIYAITFLLVGGLGRIIAFFIEFRLRRSLW